ncbi:unnamed protein product [Spirodela intermedia]|uniref:MPN domain-containing protein n=1 Tax=Spirodela intermedia TaxID=51605 RepID=A0A7I8J5Q9_SPIIN|nr:unnamed protein product [Spirodela intermedia]CAA6665567.1 unnamed protein product [Spirodela intermedia]
MDIAGRAASNSPIPLSCHYRVANLFLRQVKVYQEEGNAEDLSQVVTRYMRQLYSSPHLSFIPQHQDYIAYSLKEKVHHKKLDFGIKNLEISLILSFFGNRHFSNWANTFGLVSHNRRKTSEINLLAVKHFPPSPITSWVETAPLVATVSHVTVPDSRNRKLKSLCEERLTSGTIHDIHLSAGLMEEFTTLARDNTGRDLETCGVLGASLKNSNFYVTTLIVPKQDSTSNSCQALHEEEIYALQDELNLFPLGWIHTHPSQSCFMSSIDLHTQYSYQVMLPEAFAIVVAPTDTSRNFGIFRLTDPAGISVLKECEERGFHYHREPADGTPLYEDCSNIYINPNLRFEVIDLR